jgi:hypothetical protein
MLAERIENWFDEATRKGMPQGMLKGEAKVLSAPTLAAVFEAASL